MMKSILAAAALTLALSVPALAAEMAKCDEATMMKVNEAIKADTKPEMKKEVDAAAEHMKMAEMAMKGSKMDECSMHIGKAMDQMMMQQ
ncbi:MAG: hypothetical protein HY245_04530 [Rhizobiales bacterium]|nr:hypothetical protein [Hyphomicrobiales bacterium]MBI3672683.1 hypothetical protein [Hyphomicrobiales bacterium]